MRNAMLIPLGAGVVSATLHLSITLGSPGALMCAYFAQLPIAATGLALGLMPAAVAAAFAAILVALLSTGAGTLSLFVITSALPVLMVVHFALKNRSDGAVEGYLKSSLAGLIQADQVAMDTIIATTARIFPGVAVASWILMNLVNCLLAQRFLAAANKSIRPKPIYSEVEVPLWPVTIAILGAILAFFGGESAFIGLNIMFIAAIPFFFIGLAVLHSISAAWPGRPFLLAGAYIFLVLAHWPAALLVALGTLEPWLRLREKANARHSNKGNELWT